MVGRRPGQGASPSFPSGLFLCGGGTTRECVSMSPLRPSLIFLLLFGSLLLLPSRSWGVIALRPDLEVEGFVEAKNILRTPMFDGAKFIMQRNTAQLEAKYYFLREGRVLGGVCSAPPR